MSEDNELKNLTFCECGQPNLISDYLKDKSAKDCFPTNNFVEETYHPNEVSLQSKVTDEFLHYCYNSTIRGVPRIAKSRNRKMRILWILSFISLILGFTACVYLLGRQFSEYNVIHPPRVLTDADSDFPSITICNARPLSSDGKLLIKRNNWRKPNEFSSLINNWAINEFFEKNRIKDYYLATYAMQLSSYLESLPSEKDRMSLGHSRKNFIIYCQITYLNGSKGIAQPCNAVGKWNDYIHAFFINCATYDLESKYRKTTKTMEMYLYLEEDMNEINCPDCNKYDIKSQLSGAVLGIDRPETFSNINEKSITLMPGTLTEIRLKTFENIQITPPYGRCSLDTPKKLKMFNKEFVYSEVGCKQITIQIDIERLCKCVAIEYPYNSSSLPFCAPASPFLYKNECNIRSDRNNSNCINVLENIIKNMRCKEQITQKYYRDYIENCTMPCSFLSYESDRSTSKWPTKSYQLALLDHKVFRENKLLSKPEFEPYRKIKKLVQKGNITAASEILDSTNVLERNLLAILISKPNFNLHKVEEKEVLSLTSFLSQIGGLCSIWIGLTMISIVEIFELVMQLISLFCSERKSKKLQKCNNNTNDAWGFEIKNKSYVTPVKLSTTKTKSTNDSEGIKRRGSYQSKNVNFNPEILKCQKCNEETIS